MSKQLKRWLFSLDRFEYHLRAKTARQRSKYLRNCYASYINIQDLPTYLTKDHQDAIQIILKNHYILVVTHFGEQALAQIKKRMKKSTFSLRMLQYVETEALKKAKSISQTDLADVRGAIADGIDAGDGAAEIGRRIRGKASLTPYRASVIARTETHNAATYGVVETARDAEVELGITIKKKWLPTTDNRTREAHLAMSNAPAVFLGEPFIVDGEPLDRPGDPAGKAGNIINCRCAVTLGEA